MMYIAMDFDGLRQLISDMLGGQRCSIDVEFFQNDITSFNSADLQIILTSVSVNPTYFAICLELSIVCSRKLFRADCVPYFLTGKIPVIYA